MDSDTNNNALQEFEQVITAFQDQLFRFAFFRTGSPADAQDIVQDVFIKVYRTVKHPAAIQNIKSYLFKSIANACADYRKNKKNHRDTNIEKLSEREIQYQEDASRHLMMQEEYARIEKLLKMLPEEQADTIRFRIIDNMSFTEIADISGLSVTTIKSRFKYGVHKLKNILNPKKSLYELH
ncbi:MAG TPA: RNA polymerase sigma factor [Puia sp.]|nr:RNA polymerase sigma factor [Puia sp.]